MEFLKDHMVMKEEFMMGLNKQKTEILQELNKQKLEILDEMDDKLADLKGDLVILMRKGDRKVVSLIALLRDKKVISEDEAKGLLTLEPFPQLFPS